MANPGNTGGFPHPKQSGKSIQTLANNGGKTAPKAKYRSWGQQAAANGPNPSITPSQIGKAAFKAASAAANPVWTASTGVYKAAKIQPKPVAPKPIGGRNSAAGFAPPPAKTVPVRAHTRTVTPRSKPPVNTGVVSTTPTQTQLPPTSDKPTRNGVGTGANQGFYTRQGDVQLGQGQTLGYTPGKGFYARTAPVRTRQSAGGAAGTDPYANLLLYPGQTPEQLAQAALAPQYSAISDQTAANQEALKSFTTAILQQLQQYPSQVGNNYDQAAQQIQGFAGQAASALGNLNPNAQDQAMLKAIGAPQSQQDQVAGNLQNVFGGGGAALLGMQGLIPARSLEQQRAAAEAYAGALPGIEGLAGTQAEKNLLYQAATQRNQVATQYPGLVAQYGSAKADNLAKIAALRQNDAALGIKTQQQDFNNKVTLTRLQQSQDALDYRKAAADAGAKNAAGKINASVSKVLGYVATANGTPITTKDGKIIPIAASSKAGGASAPTAHQLSQMVDAWRNGKVQNIRVQATGKDGQPAFNPSTGAPVYISQSVQVGKVGYGQAYRRLVAMQVPEKQAREYLNTAYQRGQQGRAWVSNTEQAALAKAGLPPKARVIKGQGVLSPKQTNVLRRAGLLPAGQLTREGFYVIAPGF